MVRVLTRIIRYRPIEDSNPGGDPPDEEPPEGIIFNANWPTPGTGQDEIRSAGAFTVGSNSLALAGIVMSAPEGFPPTMANVFRIRANEADGGQSSCIPRITGLGVPALGSTRSYRWYFCCRIPDAYDALQPGVDPETHPFQDGNAIGDTNWAWRVTGTAGGDGTWNGQFRIGGYSDNNRVWGRQLLLVKNVVYRFELQVERHVTDPNVYYLHAAVFDEAISETVPIYGDADFLDNGGTVSFAERPPLTFRSLANLDGFNAGYNGLGPTANANALIPFTLYDEGGVAIADGLPVGTFIGKYRGGI